MKIGIMTFHKSQSHGAMLQAFALQRTLEKLGHEPEIINYDRYYQKNQNAVSAGTLFSKAKRLIIKMASFLFQIRYKKSIAVREARFELFRTEYLKIGKQEYRMTEELENANLPYDAYITGSDQVWNPDSINHDAFYFTFLDRSKRTIAYAPSLGVSKLDNETIRNRMQEYLQHIQFLSCREKTGATILAEITKRHVEQVLDPTLLLSREEWRKWIPATPIHGRYVLCYFLGSLKYGRIYAEKVARKLGYQIVVIPQSPMDIFSHHIKAFGVGPLEFLALFASAAVICTDSFHGTIFSINFEKPFFSFCRRNPDGAASRISRLRDVLEELGLLDRLIMPGTAKIPDKIEIDYESVRIKLNEKRAYSLDYLVNSLQD